MGIKSHFNDAKTGLLKKLLKSFLNMLPIWAVLAEVTQQIREKVEATPEKEWYEPIIIVLDDVVDAMAEQEK